MNKKDKIEKEEDHDTLISKEEQNGSGEQLTSNLNNNKKDKLDITEDQYRNQLQDQNIKKDTEGEEEEEKEEEEEGEEEEKEEKEVVMRKEEGKTKNTQNIKRKVPPPPPGIPNKIKKIDFRWLSFPKRK
jgi:chromatin remodeling complex protein RSC6